MLKNSTFKVTVSYIVKIKYHKQIELNSIDQKLLFIFFKHLSCDFIMLLKLAGIFLNKEMKSLSIFIYFYFYTI